MLVDGSEITMEGEGDEEEDDEARFL